MVLTELRNYSLCFVFVFHTPFLAVRSFNVPIMADQHSAVKLAW